MGTDEKDTTVSTVTYSDTEITRFYAEVGRDVVAFDRMLRTQTETRPFVYECRFDLWPAGGRSGYGVFKGFGADGSLIAFQDGAGLVNIIRGAYGRAQAGKLRFSADQYSPNSYQERVDSFLKNERYLEEKLTSR